MLTACKSTSVKPVVPDPDTCTVALSRARLAVERWQVPLHGRSMAFVDAPPSLMDAVTLLRLNPATLRPCRSVPVVPTSSTSTVKEVASLASTANPESRTVTSWASKVAPAEAPRAILFDSAVNPWMEAVPLTALTPCRASSTSRFAA